MNEEKAVVMWAEIVSSLEELDTYYANKNESEFISDTEILNLGRILILGESISRRLENSRSFAEICKTLALQRKGKWAGMM
jgi:uncharacterized protein with HEPN domain